MTTYYLCVRFGVNGFGGLAVHLPKPVTTYADVVNMRGLAAQQMKHDPNDIVIINFIELGGAR